VRPQQDNGLLKWTVVVSGTWCPVSLHGSDEVTESSTPVMPVSGSEPAFSGHMAFHDNCLFSACTTGCFVAFSQYPPESEAAVRKFFFVCARVRLQTRPTRDQNSHTLSLIEPHIGPSPTLFSGSSAAGAPSFVHILPSSIPTPNPNPLHHQSGQARPVILSIGAYEGPECCLHTLKRESD